MAKKRKEFSVLKCIVFPLNSVVLAAIVAYFNLTVFGMHDGLPYTAIVCLIRIFSVIINKYTESENRSLARAAFVFEIVLTAALIINACYSVSVQRKMSVAKMAETSQKETIGEISKLRGSRTQREALQKIDKPESAQSVFADVENILFWIMVGDLALYGLSAFTLFALAKLTEESRVPEEFPDELEISTRSRNSRRADFEATHVSSKNGDTDSHRKTTQDDTGEGLRRLREALQLISFHTPGQHFKADLKDDCVWLRSMVSDRGVQRTHQATKANLSILSDAVRMKLEEFRARLEKFLRDREFEI
jgi:hypothetical protein